MESVRGDGTTWRLPEYMEWVTHHLTHNPHLLPHLRELCSMLAAALVRHRCRTAEELARDAAEPGSVGGHFANPSPPTRAVMPTHPAGDTHDHALPE